MASAKPQAYTVGSNPVLKFEGAFHVTKLPIPPSRAIQFYVKTYSHHPRLKAMEASGKKPPTHFHIRQHEYFHVAKGSLTVEINGVAHKFTAKDGGYALPPRPHHWIYGTPNQSATSVEFWLGASEIQGRDEKQLDQASSGTATAIRCGEEEDGNLMGRDDRGISFSEA